MVDDQFRAVVLSLPDVTRGVHAGLETFKVRNRRFSTLGWPARAWVTFALSVEDQEMVLVSCANFVERSPGAWGRLGHCRLDLAMADVSTTRNLMMMAYRRITRRGST